MPDKPTLGGRRRLCLAPLAAFGLALRPARAASVVDHLGVPGPIALGGRTYALAWSARPTATYAKHEYVPAGQAVERYRHMLLLEALQGKVVPEVVQDKLKALRQRAPSDPLQRHSVMENARRDEVIVDFLLGARLPDGQEVVEWNAYRYAAWRGSGTPGGTLLLALSARGYGAGVQAFLQDLKGQRPQQIQALAQAALPAVALR